MMCITSRVGETGSSLGDCGVLNTCVEATACGWIGSYLWSQNKNHLAGGLGVLFMWEHLVTGTSAKLLYFPRISFPFPFPCPMRRGCLTVSAQETHVLILLNPLTHGEPDGSSMCSIWVCFFISVLWFNTAFSACCQKGHSQQGPTPAFNALPYVSSVNALPDEIWRTLSNGLFRDATCLEARTDWKGNHDSWIFPILVFLVTFFRVSLASLCHAKSGDHCHTYLTGVLWG